MARPGGGNPLVMLARSDGVVATSSLNAAGAQAPKSSRVWTENDFQVLGDLGAMQEGSLTPVPHQNQ